MNFSQQCEGGKTYGSILNSLTCIWFLKTRDSRKVLNQNLYLAFVFHSFYFAFHNFIFFYWYAFIRGYGTVTVWSLYKLLNVFLLQPFISQVSEVWITFFYQLNLKCYWTALNLYKQSMVKCRENEKCVFHRIYTVN